QKTPGTANHEGPVPTGPCSSTSPLATRPSRPKPGKPRAPGQVAARTGEGLAHPPAHLLPLHRPRPPPLSPPCRPAPLPPPPKRRRPLSPHHHSSSSSSSNSSSSSWQQPARVVGGGVLKGSTPPPLRCPTEAAVAMPAPAKRGGRQARSQVLTQAAWPLPALLGTCTLTLSRLERRVMQAAVVIALRRAAWLRLAVLTGTSRAPHAQPARYRAHLHKRRDLADTASRVQESQGRLDRASREHPRKAPSLHEQAFSVADQSDLECSAELKLDLLESWLSMPEQVTGDMSLHDLVGQAGENVFDDVIGSPMSFSQGLPSPLFPDSLVPERTPSDSQKQALRRHLDDQ
ncbi:hypothetical protein M9458_014848, partial [Cirrhinus mrigala]